MRDPDYVSVVPAREYVDLRCDAPTFRNRVLLDTPDVAEMPLRETARPPAPGPPGLGPARGVRGLSYGAVRQAHAQDPRLPEDAASGRRVLLRDGVVDAEDDATTGAPALSRRTLDPEPVPAPTPP